MDIDIISLIKQILPALTVVAEAAIGVFVLFLVAGILGMGKASILWFMRRRALFLSLVIALVGTLGSLFYSEVVGLAPCTLCWYARIFFFPQPLLLAIALWREDRSIANYVFPMSVIGTLVTGYHYLLQFGFVPPPPCSIGGFSISCAEKSFVAFGFITIPLMAFSAFVLLALLQGTLLFSEHTKEPTEAADKTM